MKHRFKSFTVEGIVIKRQNFGETDRLITLCTQQKGKIVVNAKGIRKIHSSNRASLEIGNLVKAYLIKTRTLPLLVQAQLISDCALIRNQLSEIRKLAQFLEIIEKLFVEEELEITLYHEVLAIRNGIVHQTLSSGQIKNSLKNLIEKLGYLNPRQSQFESVLDYVATLIDRPMRSFEYLQVK